MKRFWALGLILAATAAPAASEGSAPIEIVGNRVFIEARVNDETVTALLDSGAEMSILDDDFAERLALAGSGSAVARGSGAKTMEARFVENITLEAAGVRLGGPVAILDLDEVAGRLVGRPVAMILGRQFFDEGGRLRLDLDAGTIDRLEASAEPTGVPIPLAEHRGLPVLPAEVEGKPVQAVFDLGNGSEVMVGRGFAEQSGLVRRVTGRKSGGGLGGALERDTLVLDRLVVAGQLFDGVPAVIDDSDSAADLNIGTAILRRFVITTDFPNKTIWLEPRP